MWYRISDAIDSIIEIVAQILMLIAMTIFGFCGITLLGLLAKTLMGELLK
jgi:hypothetical protein